MLECLSGVTSVASPSVAKYGNLTLTASQQDNSGCLPRTICVKYLTKKTIARMGRDPCDRQAQPMRHYCVRAFVPANPE